MIQTLTNNWWLFLVRGIVAILVGAYAFMAPGTTLVAVVYVIGFFAFVAGCTAFAAALTGAAGDRWWAALLEGLVGIAAALVIWFAPMSSTEVFIYVLAGWAILTGILEIAAGIQLRDFINNEWLYVLSGVISVAFGVWVMRSPQQGALAEAYVIGCYALLFGFVQVAFSLRLRSVRESSKVLA